LQDAKAWQWPPSLMFGIKADRRPGKVTALDVLLAEGLRLYEDSLCSGCGVPARWAWDVGNARYFEIDPDSPQCQVCELLETPAAEGDRREPGEKVRVINHLIEVEGVSGG
jgi:hypothetical protein